MLKQILETENITKAYFELVEKFDTSCKTNKYTGIDGLTLKDFDTQSAELIKEVQSELQNLTALNS